MTIEEIRDRVIALEKRAEREEERHRFLEDRLIILEKTQTGVQDIRLMIERLAMGSDNTKQSFSDLTADAGRYVAVPATGRLTSIISTTWVRCAKTAW